MNYFKNVQEANDCLKKDTGFNSFLDIEIIKVSEEEFAGQIVVREELLNSYNNVHGGIIYSLADVVGGMAAIYRGKNVVTLNSSINYVNPGLGEGILTATARTVKYGRKIAVYHIEITQNKKVVANLENSYFIVEE